MCRHASPLAAPRHVEAQVLEAPAGVGAVPFVASFSAVRDDVWSRIRSRWTAGQCPRSAGYRASPTTDDSGGRTEIVRDSPGLERATVGIADELTKQYDLGYLSAGKRDGRWHSIRVELHNGSYRVRARRGYVAS